MQILQDDVLIRKIATGDRDAFLHMIETYSKLLWVVAGGILNGTGTTQDIEECISDVYVHVWKNPGSFNPERGSFKTYLAILARSKALDAYRRLSKNKIAELTEAIAASDDDLLSGIMEKESHAELYAAIKSLTEPNREIVIRRFFFEEKPARIAENTSLPVKEVENRLYQSKLKLRKLLKGGNLCTSH